MEETHHNKHQEEIPEEDFAGDEPDWMDTFTEHISTYGSSALFHCLLLITLGLITLGGANNQDENLITVAPPEKVKEKVKFIKKPDEQKIKSPVDRKERNVEPKFAEKMKDKREEDTNEKFDKDKGVSKEFKSDAKMKKKAINDTIGFRGFPGGDYGGRHGGDEDSGVPSGGSVRSVAVLPALIWLARHQSDDGHWDIYGYTNQCEGDVCEKFVSPGRSVHNVGVTGLALLAFLGAGFTHLNHTPVRDPNSDRTYDFGKVVKEGLFWLKKQQNEKGAFIDDGNKYMYDNAIAALAYAEAYGMTGSNVLLDYAQDSINYIQQAQNPYKAWRYTYQSGDNDTSVTGWCVMALKSAQIAGLKVDDSGLDSALNFVKEVTEKDYYQTGYRSKEDAGMKVRVPGKNDKYANHPAMTAIGMLVRSYVENDPESKALKKGTQLLMNDLPKWDDKAKPNSKGNPIDYYYWYYGSLALFMYAGPDSPNAGMGGYWEKWNEAMKSSLLKSQERENSGHEFGSWDPVSRWGFEGGRVYSTAINALTMEVYYRYDNAFTGQEKKKKN